MRELSGMLSAVVTDAIAQEGEALTEIRLRPGCRVRLVSGRKDRFCGAPLATEDFRRLLGAMMEHSYYAREEELAQGYFTMRNGCRVGVCGAYAPSPGGGLAMRAIGSACIRVAREVRGLCGATGRAHARARREGHNTALASGNGQDNPCCATPRACCPRAG